MAFSLYDASVANFLQILGAVGGFLDKGCAHFGEKSVDPAEIVETRLAPDMLPLPFPDRLGHPSFARCDGGREERLVRSPDRASPASTMPDCRRW